MFYLTNVLQFVIDSLDDRPFPEEYFVMEIHQRVLHVPFQLCHQVYDIDVEPFLYETRRIKLIGYDENKEFMALFACKL